MDSNKNSKGGIILSYIMMCVGISVSIIYSFLLKMLG